MIIEIIISAFIIMFASLVGVFTINKFFSRIIKEKMPYLISFSAGIFLLTSVHMLIESYEFLENIPYGFLLTLLFFIIGYILPSLLSKVIPNFHHHHDSSCHQHSQSGKKVLIGDSIHNIVDGFVLVPAFLISP
jgi:zinc transporter ZupT